MNVIRKNDHVLIGLTDQNILDITEKRALLRLLPDVGVPGVTLYIAHFDDRETMVEILERLPAGGNGSKEPANQ